MNSDSQDMPRGRVNDDGGRASRAGTRAPANGMSSHGHVRNSSSGNGNNHNNSNSQDYNGGNQRSGGSSSSSRYECKDKDCRKPVAWRNADSIGGIVPNNSSSNGINNNNMGSAPVPFYANQEAREVQMKLFDILEATGLPQADISVLGSRPAPFASLPPGAASSMPQQSTTATWQATPLQGTVAWMCARFDAERDRREWFFRERKSHLPRVASEYCEEHTCRYFFTKELCSTKKPKHDALCNTHAFCPAFRCQQIKGQIANLTSSEKSTSMFQRHEFCPKHKCEVDNCELLRDEAKNGHLGKFCPKHRCHYTGCVKQALDGRGYCIEHGCQSANCQKIAVVGYMLCKKHLECIERGCTHPRFVVPTDRVLDEKDHTECYIERYDRGFGSAYCLGYCKDHGICADKSCSKLRIKASVHCHKHACLERGCNKPCRSALKYCEFHRCGTNACMSPKGWKQDSKTREAYCFNHLCREFDCSECVDNLHMYCGLHECEIESCIAKVAEDGSCIQHFKERHKKQTKAAVRRDTEDTKIAVQRETQQWASTFGVSVGVGGGSVYGDQEHRRPLRYFPTSNHSMSNHSGGSRRSGSPLRPWQGDRDLDGNWDDDHDQNRGRDRNRGGRRNRNSGGTQGNLRMHTPSSSDAGRSRYRGRNDDDSDDYVPVAPNPQPPPAMAAGPTASAPRKGPVQQQQPGIVRPTPQNAARPGVPSGNNPNNANSSGPNFVFFNRGPQPGNSGSEPIIHQRQPSYQDDEDNYGDNDGFLR